MLIEWEGYWRDGRAPRCQHVKRVVAELIQVLAVQM